MQSFFAKAVLSYFVWGRGNTMLYLHIFVHLHILFALFVVQSMTFQAKLRSQWL